MIYLIDMTSEASDKIKVKGESPTLPSEMAEDTTERSTSERRKVVIVTPTESDHKDSKGKKVTKKNKHSRFLPKPKK